MDEREQRTSQDLIRQAHERIRAFDDAPSPDGAAVVAEHLAEEPSPVGMTAGSPAQYRSPQGTPDEPDVSEPPVEPQPSRFGGPFWASVIVRVVVGLLVFGGWWLFTSFDDAERGSDGEIVGGGDLDVTTLGQGDCFDDPDGDVIYDVQAVPCSEPHDNEVFATGSLAGAFGQNYPGLESVDAYAYQTCIGSPFESYVGASFDTSSLGVFTLIPTEESWGDGDRGYVCALYDYDLTPLTGSVLGSGR